MSRRALLQGGVTGVLAAAGLTAYEIYQARYVNPYSPQLERVDLAVPSGSEGLAGMKIGFITDTHVGPFVETGDLYRALDLIRAESPDLILLGGDYISESPRYAPETASAIGNLLSGRAARWLRRDREPRPLGLAHTGAGGAGNGRHPGTCATRRPWSHYGGAQLAIAGIDETLLGDPQPVGDDCAGADRRAGAGALARAGVRRAGSGCSAPSPSSRATHMAVRSGCRGSAQSGSRCMASGT